MGNRILLLIAGLGPITIGAQVFIEIAAVIIDEVVAALHDLLGDEVRNPVGLGAIDFAGIKAVHALAVHRIHMRHFLQERWNVHQRQNNDGPGKLRWINPRNKLFQGNYRCVFRAVQP